MNEEQRRVNDIANKLWVTLIETGETNLASLHRVEPKLVMTKAELSEWISKNLFPGVSLWDEKYYFESIDFYNKIIPYNWIQRKKYIEDRFDCDNFATKFNSYISDVFGLNTTGVSTGEVYGIYTDKLVGRHAYNMILATDNGVLKPYLFEPMKNIIAEWKGQKTALGDWKYTVEWSDFR
jgi:hypothetical protein